MTRLPNTYYKETDDKEELHRIIQHLHSRVLEQAKELEEMKVLVAENKASREKAYTELNSMVRDETAIKDAKRVLQAFRTIKGVWEGA